MKKVLFVFNHPAPYKVRLLNKLSEFLDLDVIFERHKASDRNKAFYYERDYKFNLLPIKGIKVGAENFISKGIVKAIKRRHYDYVIMNGYSTFTEMKAIKYLKSIGEPYCLYINGGIINRDEPRWKTNLKRKYISGAEFYMSPDENSDNYLVYYGAIQSLIKSYTYSTVYESEIIKSLPSEKEIRDLKEDLHIYADKVYVSCGQLIKRKNYIDLIKAWPNDKNKVLIIIGDGKQRKHIQNLIKKNSIRNVKLIGYQQRERMFDYYKIANGFIFPSRKDIYGHVINEALSQGLPVISFENVNSAKKLIEEGKNGYIVNSIEDLISSLEKLDRCDKKYCVEIAKKNTIEIMVEEHKKILA